MEEIHKNPSSKDKKGYNIPIGASNAIGSLGYTENINRLFVRNNQDEYR